MFDLFWGRGDQTRSTRVSTVYLFNCFKFLAICPTEKWKRLYHLYASLVLFGANICLPVTLSLSLILSFDQMTTTQFLTNLQVTINIVGLPMKVLTLKWYLKYLKEAEEIMNTLDERCHLKEEFQIIRNCSISGNRITLFYSCFYMLCSFFMFTNSLIIGTPVYAIYLKPLDWRNSYWEFFLQFSVEFLLVNYSCFQQAMTDAYAVIYIYILRSHMQILVERVKKLGSDKEKTLQENYEELVACVKDHQNLLRLYNQIHAIISVTLFVQFVFTAGILVTTVINILLFADRSAQIASTIYFLAVLLQTSPCCYQATILLDESEQLPLAILQCEWWAQDKRFRKVLIYFMQCSQRPMTLSAMKLFDITLDTNVSIAKFTFSLYTLIENMDFGKDIKMEELQN